MEDCGVWIVWEGSGSLIAASQQGLKCLPRYPLASSPPPRNHKYSSACLSQSWYLSRPAVAEFFPGDGIFFFRKQCKIYVIYAILCLCMSFCPQKMTRFFFIIYVIFMQIHVIYTILCVNRLLLRISKCGIFHFFLLIFFASKTAVAEFLYKYKIWPFLEPITQFNP